MGYKKPWMGLITSLQTCSKRGRRIKIKMKILLSIAVLGALGTLLSVNANCELKYKEIDKERRQFVVTDASGNPSRLFLKDFLAVNEEVSLLCDASAPLKQVQCQSNSELSDRLPSSGCKTPSKATVQQGNDKECKHQSLRVGFEYKNQFVEAYSVCFNKQTLAVVHVKHTAVGYHTSANRVEQQFTLDGFLTENQAKSYKRTNIKTRFDQLLGKGQRFVVNDNESVIDRGHMTPSADFVFPGPMRATFKYINVVPMFSAINRGNWKKIEMWIRSEARRGEEIKIKTGSVGVLELPQSQRSHPKKSSKVIPIYLHGKGQIPVPKWLYKDVQYKNGRHVVLLTYNNIFGSTTPKPICSVDSCPKGLKLDANIGQGFTFCCKVGTLKL